MPKSLVVAIVLCASAGTAAAQTAPAAPAANEPASSAYYEFMIGLHLESQGDGAGASAAYQRAEKLDPQSAEIPAALAELYARMNRPSDAIAVAVTCDPPLPIYVAEDVLNDVIGEQQ